MSEWVLIIDDDASALRAASHILVSAGMRASAIKSGEEALARLKSGAIACDLILLDIHMPGMDGFEILRHLKADPALAPIPVMFLTADDDSAQETKGLEAGAVDFIKKPFVPSVLVTRSRRTIEYTRLRNDLEAQVRQKSAAVVEQQERLARMSLQVVLALSGAVDAKDAYTKSHSRRVAEYARTIALRYGYDEKRAQRIYTIGLLHDIGKIGVPSAIINKPGRLTDEEYEIIKTHTTIGDQILKNMPDFPEFAIGARWHHERFDGHGYPDGLAGTDIPEEARIIAVADAYDAMSSRRSYRDALPQDVVRAEIVRCSGTQFDPTFAEIWLSVIDEDGDYRLSQRDDA